MPTKKIIGYVAASVAVFLILIPIFILIISEPSSSGSSTSTNGTTAETIEVPKEELVYVTAVEMINEYQSNEISADAKYKGKSVVVTGIISDIGKTEDLFGDGTPYVLFSSSGSSNTFVTVQANFSNKSEIEKLASLGKGQQVSIKGTCGGESIFNVMLNNCFVIE
jgi:hypothetical protein